MKLSLILCSVILALVVVPELVAAKPKVPQPGLDEKFEGTILKPKLFHKDISVIFPSLY